VLAHTSFPKEVKPKHKHRFNAVVIARRHGSVVPFSDKRFSRTDLSALTGATIFFFHFLLAILKQISKRLT
jgi:hypothetical protein